MDDKHDVAADLAGGDKCDVAADLTGGARSTTVTKEASGFRYFIYQLLLSRLQYVQDCF